jgi:hypothetical protein
MAPWRGIGATLGSLRGAERLAAIGAAAVPVSLLLPWYGYRFLGGLSQTGLDAFGFGQAALLVTVAATLFLIVRCARGYRPPRPLSEGALLIAAGVWMAILLGYLILDRPDQFEPLEARLRYGIFVALGGSLAVVVGGMRLRRDGDGGVRHTDPARDV